jgi:hypothetical protein
MKTMTCKQLGGPDSCDHKFQAETFDEIADLSRDHGMEMTVKQDPAHLKAMEEMAEKMQAPEAMQKWFEDVRSEFEALPEDQ